MAGLQGCRRAETGVVAALRTEAEDGCVGREAQRTAVRAKRPRAETGLLHADWL